MIFPRLNRNGGAISELWKVVKQICEILPDLVVKGGHGIQVSNLKGGQIVSAIRNPVGGRGGGISKTETITTTTIEDPWLTYSHYPHIEKEEVKKTLSNGEKETVNGKDGKPLYQFKLVINAGSVVVGGTKISFDKVTQDLGTRDNRKMGKNPFTVTRQIKWTNSTGWDHGTGIVGVTPEFTSATSTSYIEVIPICICMWENSETEPKLTQKYQTPRRYIPVYTNGGFLS